MRSITYITAIFLLISGNIYKSFNVPDIEQPEIAGSDISVADTLISLPSWKEYFADQKLQHLIETALVANSDLRIAQQNIVQSEASLLSSKLSYLPSFILSPEGGISSFDNNTIKTYNLPITTQWEIDLS